MLVTFSLDIDPIQSERILVNHTIYAVIAAAAKRAAGTRRRTAITHAQKKIDDEAFKKIGWRGSDAIEEVLRKRCLDLLMRNSHDFVRCLFLARKYRFYRTTRILRCALSRLFLELPEFFELAQKIIIYPRGVRFEYLQPARRDLEISAPGCFN